MTFLIVTQAVFEPGGIGERRAARGEAKENEFGSPGPTLLFVILAVFEPGSRFLFDTARCSLLLSDSRITIHE
jgi:hypothetical protein